MLFLLSIILLMSIIGIVAGIALIILYDVNEKRIEVERNVNKKIRTEEELMKIVLNVLERKWAYRVQFHFKIKEISVPKFEFEWNYLLNETISSLSQDVLDELKYYYKDDETTIKAVSELVQIYLYDYMERQKIK